MKKRWILAGMLSAVAATPLMAGAPTAPKCSRNQEDIKSELIYVNDAGEFCALEENTSEFLLTPNAGETGEREVSIKSKRTARVGQSDGEAGAEPMSAGDVPISDVPPTMPARDNQPE